MISCSSPLSSAPASLISSPLSSIGSRSLSPTPHLQPFCPSSSPNHILKLSIVPKKRNARDFPTERVTATKRQRITAPKTRNTEYLDLLSLNQVNDEEFHKLQDAKLNKLLEVLRTKRKIVVFAGAGISVSAGIPDFRSSTGLFKTLRADHKLKASGKQLFDADVYRSSDATSSFHAMVRELSQKTKNASPTPFHDMLATLAEEGRLMRLYTQNVDGIDVRLQPLATNVPLNVKGPWPKAIQLHGGLGKMVCSKCGFLADFDASLFEGPNAPPCSECEEKEEVRKAAGLRSHGVGRLRPRILLYNEHNPDEDAIGAVSFADITKGPDAVIVVGTSLQVPGIRRLAKEMCLKTRCRKNGFTAWINCDSEPAGIEFKDCWDMVVRAECDDIARIVGLPKWDDKDCGDYSVLKKEITSVPSNKCHVVIDPKPELLPEQVNPITSKNPPKQIQISNDPAKNLNQPDVKHPKLKISAPTKPGDSKQKKKSGRKPLPSRPTKSVTKSGNKITRNFNLTKSSRPARQSTKELKVDSSLSHVKSNV
ncbi:NAD-dependent protein deacetylase hst4 [Podosphaera aphanis]|nr:NAD-dependent protein deacetylase hst4 [Podosphaera aphanis]